jgi:hypothetical protein
MQPSDEQQLIINHVLEGRNVVVDACAGSGKSTTILSTAMAMPDTQFLQITYNSSLRKEIKEKVKTLNLKNLAIHTYHSLAVAKYFDGAHTDTGIRQILYQKMPPKTEIQAKQIIVLDETQDMTMLYFQFIVKFLRDMGTPILLMILGDYMQCLYEFKGADSRFLTLAHEIWPAYDGLKTTEFARCSLKMSYRITNPMADFVNRVMIGDERLLACRDGEPVHYMRGTSRNLQTMVVFQIKELIRTGSAQPDEIFVLGASVKGENSQIRRIENGLSDAGIPCYVPTFEDAKIDERIMAKKVVFSTFHCVKGRQRPFVFVIGFDQSYMNFFCRDLDETKCPNTLYVATTRATKKMFLLENDQFVEDKPLSFLRMGHHEMRRTPYIHFQGTPQSVFYDTKDAATAEIKCHKITPTDLIKFIPEHVLEEITPLLNRMFETERAAADAIDIPTIVQLSDGFFEDVSDLNGIAIPSIYFDYLEALWTKNIDQSILYDIVEGIVRNLKPYEHAFLKTMFRTLDRRCETIQDYLYLSNVYVATKERLYFKLKTLKKEMCTWLTDDVLGQCKTRLYDILGEECERGTKKPDAEQTIVHALNEEEHVLLDQRLSPHFPAKKFRFSARADLITEQTLWELKCTSSLTQDHLLQLIIYAYIWRTKNPGQAREFKLLNIRTGEVLRLTQDYGQLEEIMLHLLRGKYGEQVTTTSENFIEQCHKYLHA